MLIENVNGTRRASSMLKDSKFYIEVAKFVQAYTIIINNPNEFLAEIHEPLIDTEKSKLTWGQFVNIVQKCNLGFVVKPTPTDLLVYYNYALEIGSIDDKEQRIASVGDVANAQKHYYNFVDDAKERAQAEYFRQRRITEMRESEVAAVDNKMSAVKAKNYICFIFMMLACFIGGFGIVSLIASNEVVLKIGSFISVWKAQYVGAIILILLALLIYWIFDKLYIKTKTQYVKLRQASATLFERNDENYLIETMLKRKLTMVNKDFKVVQSELNDKSKKFDVLHNIEALKHSNKYYSKYATIETPEDSKEQQNAQSLATSGDEQSEFAPIKLTKEQSENLRKVSKEAIKLEGVFDVDAYNEKFEKSNKPEKEEQKEDEAVQEQQEQQQKEEDKQQEQQNQEDLLESIDFIKNILGLGVEENEAEKSK